jgi:hypothetical protein
VLTFSGAPEYCRDEAHTFLESTIFEAKPSQDIWSLGCVWSEAAVWSVLGREALNEYRRDRVVATDRVERLRSTAYSGCFHDGEKVISTVLTMHNRVREERRRNDFVVHDIVTIIEDMLEEASSRPDAMQIHDRYHKIFRNVQVILEPVRVIFEPESTDSPLGSQFPVIFQTPSDELGMETGSLNTVLEVGGRQEAFHHLAFDLDMRPGSSMTGTTVGGSSTYSTPLVNELSIPSRRFPPPYANSYPSAQSTNFFSLPHSSRAPRSSLLLGKTHPAQFQPEDTLSYHMPYSDQALARLPKPPKVTITEVDKWIKLPKARRNLSPLPGHDYLEKLYGRDQVSYEHFIYI